MIKGRGFITWALGQRNSLTGVFLAFSLATGMEGRGVRKGWLTGRKGRDWGVGCLVRQRKRFSGRGSKARAHGSSGLCFSCILTQGWKERRAWTWESDQHGLASQPQLSLNRGAIAKLLVCCEGYRKRREATGVVPVICRVLGKLDWPSHQGEHWSYPDAGRSPGARKTLEPDAKAFRCPGGVDGKGWYYMIDAHASKEEALEERQNSNGLEQTMKSEGTAFLWGGPGGVCHLRITQGSSTVKPQGQFRGSSCLLFLFFFSASGSWDRIYFSFLLAIACTPSFP